MEAPLSTHYLLHINNVWDLLLIETDSDPLILIMVDVFDLNLFITLIETSSDPLILIMLSTFDSQSVGPLHHTNWDTQRPISIYCTLYLPNMFSTCIDKDPVIWPVNSSVETIVLTHQQKLWLAIIKGVTKSVLSFLVQLMESVLHCMDDLVRSDTLAWQCQFPCNNCVQLPHTIPLSILLIVSSFVHCTLILAPVWVILFCNTSSCCVTTTEDTCGLDTEIVSFCSRFFLSWSMNETKGSNKFVRSSLSTCSSFRTKCGLFFCSVSFLCL